MSEEEASSASGRTLMNAGSIVGIWKLLCIEPGFQRHGEKPKTYNPLFPTPSDTENRFASIGT
jgi:hypothetical protein